MLVDVLLSDCDEEARFLAAASSLVARAGSVAAIWAAVASSWALALVFRAFEVSPSEVITSLNNSS